MKGIFDLVIISQLLALSACSQKINDVAQAKVIQASAVFSTYISPGIIDSKDYLQIVSSYNDFKEIADRFEFKERGVSVFEEDYFKQNDVIIIGIPTAPALKYNLSKILRTGSNARVYIEQKGPETVIMTEVVVCIMIGINKDDADGIQNYGISYERVITK